jgi:hypothetical protein
MYYTLITDFPTTDRLDNVFGSNNNTHVETKQTAKTIHNLQSTKMTKPNPSLGLANKQPERSRISQKRKSTRIHGLERVTKN